MTPAQSKTEFRRRLGRPLKQITLRQAADAMVAFYVEQRAEGVLIGEDGDMLLYEWGVYDFDGPESFQVSITRQFIVAEEDEPYQLKLNLHFAPDQPLRDLGSGDSWCRSPDEVASFKETINASAAFVAVADAKPTRASLSFEAC